MKYFFLSRFSISRSAVLGAFAISFLPLLCQAQTEEAVIPQGYAVDRYTPLWKKSPFTLSSTSTEAVAGFAENLALAGVVKIGNESYVSIVDKTTQKRELISTSPNAQGIQLLKLESSPDFEKVTVTLQKGSEKSILRYDMAYLKTSSKSSEQNGQPANLPGQPPNQNGTVNPTTTSGPPNAPNRPIRRRLVPSQPGNAQPAAPNLPAKS